MGRQKTGGNFGPHRDNTTVGCAAPRTKSPAQRGSGASFGQQYGACLRHQRQTRYNAAPQHRLHSARRLASREINRDPVRLYTHAHTVLGSARTRKSPAKAGLSRTMRAATATTAANDQQQLGRSRHSIYSRHPPRSSFAGSQARVGRPHRNQRLGVSLVACRLGSIAVDSSGAGSARRQVPFWK